MKTENIIIKIIALILEEKLVFNEFLSSKKALEEFEFLKVELFKNLDNDAYKEKKLSVEFCNGDVLLYPSMEIIKNENLQFINQ